MITCLEYFLKSAACSLIECVYIVLKDGEPDGKGRNNMAGINGQRTYLEAKLIMLLRQLVEKWDTGLTWDDGRVEEQLHWAGHFNIYAGWACDYCEGELRTKSDEGPIDFPHAKICPIEQAKYELVILDMWGK